MKCMLKNTNFTFVPLLNETIMVNPRKPIVWIITDSETAKKGKESNSLDMLVFCNGS